MTPVRRNALLLAAGLVFQSGMIQLAVALGTVTIVAVTGVKSILGLGPAVFLLAGGAAVGPAGRLSDRLGRMPVIRFGFVLGIVTRPLLAFPHAAITAHSSARGFRAAPPVSPEWASRPAVSKLSRAARSPRRP